MKSADLVGAIESCYQIEKGFVPWLAGVHEALSPILDRGLGTCGYRYDLLTGRLRVHETVEKGVKVDLKAMLGALSTVTPEYIEASFRATQSGTGAEVEGFDDQLVTKRFLHAAGVVDAVVINALAPDGQGVLVGAFVGERLKVSSRTRTIYDRLSAHLGAGYRLERRLRSAAAVTTNADAVLSPDGVVLHLERQAEDAREALALAARAIDQARGKLRRGDPEEALSRWRGLVSASWSLVDTFESDGKHYLVAKANAPEVPEVGELTPRERQVLAHAALGHHNKLIAYELGIAASTVRVLIGRAAKRLGTATRAETVASFVALRDAKGPGAGR